MIELKSILFLVFLVGIAKADYCQDNFTLAEFPEGIRKQTLMVLLTGTIPDFGGCPANVSITDDDVRFWLWNREHPKDGMLLNPNKVVHIDPSKPLKFIIHGWLCNITNDRMPELKDAFLKRCDANVIGVDWSALSVDLYTTSYCKAPLVAEVLGKFICKLTATVNIDPTKLHILGHSMGGQIAGLAGQEVQNKCNRKIGRISGLDPAGPLYQGSPIAERLDKNDALFVDVIHSNQASAGYYGSCGALDFFPNCGTFQPGCLRVDDTTTIKDIINLPLSRINCNHVRSVDYYIESINSNRFKSKSCNKCPGLPIIGICIPDIIFPKYLNMGEDLSWNAMHGKYFLTTNSKPPFAQG